MVCYVKNGSKGVMVKAVQVKLSSLGFYKGSIDSWCGPVLTAAIKNYQKNKKLVQDGCVGEITWKSLFGVPYPQTVKKSTSSGSAAPVYNSDKDPFLKSLAAAIGGKFNTLSECYNLIRKNESYANYQLDKKAQAEAVASLARNTGLNCVDYSQIMAAVCDKLNEVAYKGYAYRYVRTYCVKSKTGHVYLESKGAELGQSWVSVDAAAGASAGSKYPIGKAWCSDYPEKIYNQDYLKLDDGI
jgi:hypothetical protein